MRATRKMGKKEHIYLMSKKRQLDFIRHTMRKAGLDNVIFRGQTEGRRHSGKEGIPNIASLCKLISGTGLGEIPKRENLLSAAKDGTFWRTKIANIL